MGFLYFAAINCLTKFRYLLIMKTLLKITFEKVCSLPYFLLQAKVFFQYFANPSSDPDQYLEIGSGPSQLRE